MEAPSFIPDYKPERVLLSLAREGKSKFEPEEERVFSRWLGILNEADVPYIVGGAFAVHAYTGIWRDTKDLDVFLKPKNIKRALDVLASEGFRTEVRAAHWLAKVHQEPYLMDLIFGIGNGQLRVDDDWFAYSKPAEIAGVEVRVLPLEELIASKLYVATRDRFDGADVVHLIRGAKGSIDWTRVLAMLGKHWELLLWHFILFDFVYPGHADYLPKELVMDLFERVKKRWNVSHDQKSFRGILLDQFMFVVDIKDWGYEDLRNLNPLVGADGSLV